VAPGTAPQAQARPLGPKPRSAPDETRTVLAPVPGGLTAEVVAERSLASSHTVRARLAELDAARARLDQTTAQFFPRLTLRASYTRLSPVSAELGGALVGAGNPGLLSTGPCPGGGGGDCVLDAAGQPVGAAEFAIESFEDNYALTAQLSVPISDYILRLSSAAAGAAANRKAAELQVDAERLKVRTDAQALFYDWLRARARVAVAEKSLERTRARLAESRPAFELGTITRADLLRLEALEASTEQVVLEARSYAELSELSLALAMGDPAPRGYSVGEDIEAAAPPVQESLERLTGEALKTRLELEALEQSARSIRLAGKAVRTGALPRIDAVAEVTYANPNQRYFPPQEKWQATWSAGVAATWTIGDVAIQGAAARELSANAEALIAQRSALANAIRQEVAMHYLAYQRAVGALASAERGLAAAEEAYRVASDLYRYGKATTTQVIDAEADLLSARLSELDARIERRIAEVRLRHAAGRDRDALR